MTRRGWSADQVPPQEGRVFVVTGANSGIGLEAARVLADRGARVVMACRNLEKAERAADDIRRDHPSADLEVRALDLADLSSVRAFAEGVLEAHERIDVLVNNAGVMAIPRRETADGFEMQLGTNHLGHFALTALLLPRLIEQGGTRVVTVSSTAHKMGRMHFDDLQLARDYGDWKAYGQSKLANLLFAFELHRRLRGAGHEVRSLACHPGYADTDLQQVGPRVRGSRVMGAVMKVANRLVAQSAEGGALPTLRAATDPDAASGTYWGPGGFMEIGGAPVEVEPNDHARDEDDAARLWTVSEELTGVAMPV
jgi:NAD(P)-dependent dehydrogenase (short-subunit alcohol dehydrogenase family)